MRRVGYDAKNAAHLIQLLRMGIEFLTEGTLHVERADGPELLDTKRGAWSLEKVKAESERLFQLAQEAYVRSPSHPNRTARAPSVCAGDDFGVPQPFAKVSGVLWLSVTVGISLGYGQYHLR